jgi:putative transcriptional regulator
LVYRKKSLRSASAFPVGTLRDWEQGRVEPDQAARAYLTVIARNPKAVRKALEPTE